MHLILNTELGIPEHPTITACGGGILLTDTKDVNLLMWCQLDNQQDDLTKELVLVNKALVELLANTDKIDATNTFTYYGKQQAFIGKLFTNLTDHNQLNMLKSSKAPFNTPAIGELITELLTHWLSMQSIGFTYTQKSIPGTEFEKVKQFTDALAYRGAMVDKDTVVVEWLTDKEINKPKKPDTPTLLCDNLLFAIGTVDNQIDKGFLYFTGSGDLNNTKTKASAGKKDDNESKFLYFTGSYGKLRYFGRPCAHDRYNVVLLKESYPLIEQLKVQQAKIVEDIYKLSQMSVFRLTECLSATAQQHLNQYGGNYLGVTKKGDLFTLTKGKKELSHVMYPPKLAFKIRDIFEQNTNRLFSVLDGSWEERGYTLTDVTDYFYQRDAKGKLKVHEDIKQNTKQIKVEVMCPIQKKLHKLLCIIGIDTPDRTSFSQWVKLNPKIQLLAKPLTSFEYQYAVIVTNDEGWMYWTCEYGSKHYLKGARKAAEK